VNALAGFLFTAIEVFRFVTGGAGRGYGIGPLKRLRLAWTARSNCKVARSQLASLFTEHLVLMQAILSIDPAIQGDVAEFGCYKGISSANLSLACRLCNRRLLVFDSFQGLPEVAETVTHIADGSRQQYKTGEYAGSLATVKENIRLFGDLAVCEFIEGFFDQTLPHRPAGERYVLIFEDADLPSSVKTVLDHAWPRLIPGGRFFCHEARDLEVVQLFYDTPYWLTRHARPCPGVVGAGIGLPLAVGLGNPAIHISLGSYLCVAAKT
jgi:O-methyltransferase